MFPLSHFLNDKLFSIQQTLTSSVAFLGYRSLCYAAYPLFNITSFLLIFSICPNHSRTVSSTLSFKLLWSPYLPLFIPHTTHSLLLKGSEFKHNISATRLTSIYFFYLILQKSKLYYIKNRHYLEQKALLFLQSSLISDFKVQSISLVLTSFC